ncbi:Transcriptional repressor SdpR [Streptomyces hundungensis]|uniref:Transcriptional repressor SdpR n=1 Tax=Streptomyces hundungensis TaxID=1077946 RepID=A0A387HBV8_9ACTN|nr:Transcriptional repressor SdpR [Streptomyces hundungensis]
MSVTIDITGLPPERIGFAISPLAELGLALHALSEPGHHPGLHGWVTATAAALKPDLADRLHEAEFLWRHTFSDVFMPFAGIPGRDGGTGATLAEDLDLLDRLSNERFASAALEFTCNLYTVKTPSPLHDPAMRARALELAANRGPRVVDFTRRLLDDPASVRAWLRRLLEDCDQAFFADTWRRMRVQLAADARHKAELLRHKGLTEAVQAVSAALSVDDGGNRIGVDKLSEGHTTALDPEPGAGLTFMPTSFGWPHLMVLHAPGWRPVIHYPVHGPELPSPASVELLKRRMEALAHPMRMRLCRNLARSPNTTGELAEQHGISAPEVSRHLAVLKRAGLLTTRRRGRYVLHQLDLTVVARLGSDFLEGVLR